MKTNITIEFMSRTRGSKNAQKRPSVNYSTTIPLEIPWEEAWEVIEDIIQNYFPNENVKLETLTEDAAQYRYCFSVIDNAVIPEAFEVTIDV